MATPKNTTSTGTTQPKFAGRAQRVERTRPSTITLGRDLHNRFNEKTWGWLEEANDGPVVGIDYERLEDGKVVKIWPAGADEMGSETAPVKLGPQGRTATCLASNGFYREDVPLLALGSVTFPAEKVQPEEGKGYILVNARKPKLAKAKKSGAQPKGKRKRKPKPTEEGATKDAKTETKPETKADPKKDGAAGGQT